MDTKDQHLFLQGISLFNAEKFYECHEALEQIWLHDRSESRLFYQGLIQLASAFHHVQKGRMDPALKVLKKALEKLEPYSVEEGGIKLGELLLEARAWTETKPFPKIYPVK